MNAYDQASLASRPYGVTFLLAGEEGLKGGVPSTACNAPISFSNS